MDDGESRIALILSKTFQLQDLAEASDMQVNIDLERVACLRIANASLRPEKAATTLCCSPSVRNSGLLWKVGPEESRRERDLVYCSWREARKWLSFSCHLDNLIQFLKSRERAIGSALEKWRWRVCV